MKCIVVGETGTTQGSLIQAEKIQKLSLLGKNSGNPCFPLYRLIEKFNVFCFRHLRLPQNCSNLNRRNLGYSRLTPSLLLQLETETLSSDISIIFSLFIISFSTLNQLLFFIFLDIFIAFTTIFPLFVFFICYRILIPFTSILMFFEETNNLRENAEALICLYKQLNDLDYCTITFLSGNCECIYVPNKTDCLNSVF